MRKISSLAAVLAMSCSASAQVHRFGLFEQTLAAATEYGNPLKDVAVVVTFDGPQNTKDEVRAFWDGGRTWKVRYTPEQTGAYKYTVRSADKGLNGKSGSFEVKDYDGQNPLYRDGGPRLSFNRRYLVQSGSKPWFFLSDTAWNGALLSTDEEWKQYLADRSAKRFTAVQFVTTQWRAGRQDEKGQAASTGANPVKVNPAFWQRMDRKISAINDAGLVAVPVMLWALASKENESPGVSLSDEDAKVLAQYISTRYAAHKVIWMLGGDGDYAGNNVPRWKSIGRGVFPEGRKRHLAGIHPRGMRSPWAEYKDEGWLDIFFYQSGHGDDAKKWEWNGTQGPAMDWRMTPAHPVIDAEPNYEGHLSYQSQKKIDDAAVRRAAYYSLLAGPPAGVSYGAHGIWFWSRKAEVPLDHPKTGVADPWHQSLNYPGAQQMKVLRSIFDTIEWWRLRPDRFLLKEDSYDKVSFRDYVMSAMTEEDDLGMLYLPDNAQVKLNLSRFRSESVKGTWFDPRTGKSSPAGSWSARSDAVAKTPGKGDWVLILR